MSDAGHRFRRPERPQQPDLAIVARPTPLSGAGGTGHSAKRGLSEKSSTQERLRREMTVKTIAVLGTEYSESQVLPPPAWIDGMPSLDQITSDIASPLEGR